jgi:hypothetical protein
VLALSNPFDHTITFDEDYYDFDGDILRTAHGPGGFEATAWTDPGAGNRRKIQFSYDGTNWIEDWRSAADI